MELRPHSWHQPSLCFAQHALVFAQHLIRHASQFPEQFELSNLPLTVPCPSMLPLVCGTIWWNSLPATIRESKLVTLFKKAFENLSVSTVPLVAINFVSISCFSLLLYYCKCIHVFVLKVYVISSEKCNFITLFGQ